MNCNVHYLERCHSDFCFTDILPKNYRQANKSYCRNIVWQSFLVYFTLSFEVLQIQKDGV